jgi:predicted acetyltransferase
MSETPQVTVDVQVATISDKPVVSRLLELYSHDFSEFTAADVDDEGLFGYRYLDAYWTEADRHPFLIRVDGHLAGFVFVRSGEPHDMAEFFVMRKFRRSGIGAAVARDVFARFTGEWQVRQVPTNAAAVTFWRAAIPVPYDEGATDTGTVQRFRIVAPEET